MDAKEFNKHLKIYKYDVNAANELFLYCLTIITKRLLFRNGSNDLESIAHSVLEKFISNLPDHYIIAPVAYLNKCTDNFLSTLKSKREKETALTNDVSYVQSYEAVEKMEIYNKLLKCLGELDANLIYGHCVENIHEKQLAIDNNISYALARQKISRGLKKLRKILGPNVTNLDEW